MKRSRGFTLFEFVLVIMIIAVIVFLLFALAYRGHKNTETAAVEPRLTTIEAAVDAAPNDCYIGIVVGIDARHIAVFLNKHGNDFTAIPSGKWGALIHRKSCDK